MPQTGVISRDGGATNARGCRNLKGLPHNYNSCALQSLRVEMRKSVRCFPNGGELPTTLEALHIYNCENLEYLPDGIMMHHNSSCSLKYFIIGGCGSLKSFPKGVSLPSTLKQLLISQCSNLESMSENMFPNNNALEYLHLGDYPNLRFLPECLNSLKELHINGCDGLECFPARGFSTSNLTLLNISRCKNLKSLPLQMRNLKSLQVLTIFCCPELESFPDGCLAPNLTSLSVSLCQNLKTPISEWGLQSPHLSI